MPLKPDNRARTAAGQWRHSPGTPAERTFKPDGTIVSNGRNAGSWTLNGSVLVLTWPVRNAPGGAWIDRCKLSVDGKRYDGRNQQGAQIHGVKLAD